MNRDQLLEMVIECARQVADEQDLDLPPDPSGDTSLMGKKATFDSVGLVSLVLAVEEAIQDRYDVAVTLADERALSERRSPFRSLGSLAEYAGRQLEAERAGA